jgi:hypothetical protein
MKQWLLAAAVLLGASLLLTGEAKAQWGIRGHAHRNALYQASQTSWHGPYYHQQWGVPLALVVPPYANTQSAYSWGVARTTITPIYHQYQRPFPGYFEGPGPLRPTPLQPSHTDQFGTYYIRGPW